VLAISRDDSPARKSETAYEKLKELAISGQIRPGRHLIAQDIAEHLGISVTPLRDAMVRLAVEGFLDHENRHGFYSKEFRVEEQRQILDMCELLLAQGLRAAEGNIPEHLLRACAELEAVPVDPANGAPLAARVKQIYLEITRAAGNDVLYDTFRIMVERSHRMRILDLQIESAARETIDDLRTVGVAMAAKDSERAVGVVRAVFGRRGERMPLLVREANFIASEVKFP